MTELTSFPVGHTETMEFAVTDEIVDRFAQLSGDDNPLHMSDEVARSFGFPRRVAHGVLTMSFLSALIGTRLPGRGALWRSVRVEWLKPVLPGDRVRIEGTVKRQSSAAQSIVVAISATNQNGTAVLRGEATIGLGDPIATVEAEPQRMTAPARSAPGTRAVLVTGASRGIGRAIALELGRRGHPVAVGYHRSEREAVEVVSQIRELEGRAAIVHADMSSPDHADEIVEQASRSVGPILGVVHAGTPPIEQMAATDLEIDVLDTFWRVYVLGAASLVRAALPAMQEAKWGRILLVGTSFLFGPPPPKMTAYVTAKSALAGMVKSLAVELGPVGVSINMVSPSVTMTDLNRDLSPRMQLLEAQKNPMRRLASARDTASFVGFLMSDEASFINGANLPVTGGSAML